MDASIHKAKGTNRFIVIKTEDATHVAFHGFMALGADK
jgi:hypothetical protein